MSISEALVDIELTNTFEDWRVATNKALKVLRESSDDDVLNGIITTDPTGFTYVNVVSANTLTSIISTGVNLVYTGQGSTVNFTDANVVSLGYVSEIKLEGGPTVSGSNPDSYIQSVQIRDSEILLNGQAFRSEGASQIDLTEAIITNLGTVEKINVYPVVPENGTGTAGTIYGTSLKINSSFLGTLTIQYGTHNFTGATLVGGKYDSSEFYEGLIHSSDITVNTGSYLITNTSAMFATDDTSNVAIGKFPEWNGTGSSRIPTSSSGRLHVRRDFSSSAQESVEVNTNGNEFVIEGNTTVGMTLLANTTSNSHIFFGDDLEPSKGFIKYTNSSKKLTVGTNNKEVFKVYPDVGGGVQISTEGNFEDIQGKLHIHQSNIDQTHALFINSDRGDRSAIEIDADQTTANIINISTTSLRSGSILNMRYGTSLEAWTGSLVRLYDDNQTEDNRSLFILEQSHQDAIGTRLMDLYTKSGKGIFIDQDSDNYSLYIDAENTTQNTADIIVDNLSTGTGLYVKSDAGHSSNLVSFVSNNTATSGTTLYISTLAEQLVDTVLVKNDETKLFHIESTGNVGVNINEQQVQVKTGGDTVGFVYANTALHTLHVGGTLGVEANAIFNGYEVRLNSNVIIQNDSTTKLLLDATQTGYSILGIGENATELKGTTLYLTYPGGTRQGYSYVGMGEILRTEQQIGGVGNEALLYRPKNWAIEFNQYNNSLLFPGKITVANNVTITKNLHIDRNVTSSANLDVTGNTTLVHGSVVLNQSSAAKGNVYFKHVANFKSNTAFNGKNVFVSDTTSNTHFRGSLGVRGNTVIGSPGPLHVDALSYFHDDSLFKDNVRIEDNFTVDNNVYLKGNTITISSFNSIVDVNSILRHHGSNIYVSSTTSNTHVRGTSNFKGNTRFFGQNVYINSLTSNTYTRGNLNVRGNVVINGASVNVESDTDINGIFYNHGNTSFVSIDDLRSDAILKIKRSTSPVVHGNTYLLGRFTTTGNTHVKGNFKVDGKVALSGDLSMGSNKMTVQDITVNKDLTVTGNTQINGDLLDLNANLEILGTTFNHGNVSFVSIGSEGSSDTILNVERAYTSELDENNQIIETNVHGNTYLLGRFTTTGNTNVQQNLVVDGKTTLRGNLNLGSNDIFARNITLEKDATVKGTLYVSEGDIVGSDDMTLTNDLTITKGKLTVSNSAVESYFAGSLNVRNNVAVAGTLTVNDGNIIGAENLGVNGFISANGSIRAGGRISGENVLVITGNGESNIGNGVLKITGPSSQGNVWVTGNTTVSKDLTVKTKTYLDGNVVLKTSGQVKKHLKVVDTLTVLGKSYITNNVLQVTGPPTKVVNGQTVHTGNVWVTGNTTISKDVKIVGNLYVTGKQVVSQTGQAGDANFSSVDSLNDIRIVDTNNSDADFAVDSTKKFYGPRIVTYVPGVESNPAANLGYTVVREGLSVTKAAKFASTLGVTNLATLSGGISTTTISATGGFTGTTISGTSGTLSSTLDVTGVTKLNGGASAKFILIPNANVSKLADTIIDNDLEVKGTAECNGVNMRLPLYGSDGTLLNALDLNLTAPTVS